MAKPREALSLNFFVLRSQIVDLYRRFMRATQGVQPAALRLEMRREVREEFHTPAASSHWALRDEKSIKHRLAYGNEQLRALHRTLGIANTDKHTKVDSSAFKFDDE